MTPSFPSFAEWPLHDAVLSSISFDWRSSICLIDLRAFVQPDLPARSCTIAFHGVRHLVVPHHLPWGPSVYINEQRLDSGKYEIEVQSGDVIVIEADAAFFELIEEGMA